MLVNVTKYEAKQVVNALDIGIDKLKKIDENILSFLKEDTVKDLERIKMKFEALYK